MRLSELSEGDRIRIKREFRDYDGTLFEAGRELEFVERSYFPYEAGHTLRFTTSVMRLSENSDEEALIVQNEGDAYVERMT